MTKTVKLKAASLKDGDKVLIDGNILTIKSNKATIYTIPKQKLKSNRLMFEAKTRIQGKSAKSFPHATYPSDEEFDVVSRTGFQWKANRAADHVDKPAMACAMTGCVIALGNSLIPGTPIGVSVVILGMTVLVSAMVYFRPNMW
jgi:hypothetical protein